MEPVTQASAAASFEGTTEVFAYEAAALFRRTVLEVLEDRMRALQEAFYAPRSAADEPELLTAWVDTLDHRTTPDDAARTDRTTRGFLVEEHGWRAIVARAVDDGLRACSMWDPSPGAVEVITSAVMAEVGPNLERSSAPPSRAEYLVAEVGRQARQWAGMQTGDGVGAWAIVQCGVDLLAILGEDVTR